LNAVPGPPVGGITYVGSVYGSPNPFPWGVCTWWVAHRRAVTWSGNAYQWWRDAAQAGHREGQVPRVGAIMVIGITASSPLGHVAYVESVHTDGAFTISEMNWGRFGVVDLRTLASTSGMGVLGFIY
jgi:surface antigen